MPRWHKWLDIPPWQKKMLGFENMDPYDFGLEYEYGSGIWEGSVIIKPWEAQPETECLFHYSPRDPDEDLQPTEYKMIEWAISNIPSLVIELIPKLFEYYRSFASENSIEFHESTEEELPTVESEEQLYRAISFSSILLHKVQSIPAYLGFDMDCTWEEEHGFGILTHGSQIIDIGWADTALDHWKAEEHANSA